MKRTLKNISWKAEKYFRYIANDVATLKVSFPYFLI